MEKHIGFYASTPENSLERKKEKRFEFLREVTLNGKDMGQHSEKKVKSIGTKSQKSETGKDINNTYKVADYM